MSYDEINVKFRSPHNTGTPYIPGHGTIHPIDGEKLTPFQTGKSLRRWGKNSMMRRLGLHGFADGVPQMEEIELFEGNRTCQDNKEGPMRMGGLLVDAPITRSYGEDPNTDTSHKDDSAMFQRLEQNDSAYKSLGFAILFGLISYGIYYASRKGK